MKANRELLIDLTFNRPRITSAHTQQSYLMRAKKSEGQKFQRIDKPQRKINCQETCRHLEEFKTNQKEVATQEIRVGQTKLELLKKV